jgi:hypothetical protein
MKDRLYVLALEIYALYLVALAWLYGAIAWTIEEVAIPRYEFFRWLAFKVGP